MKYLILLIILCFSSLAYALPDEMLSKDKFAYGYSLEVDGDGAIYSLYLNEKIYQGMTREDRGDLRIFNSQGTMVAHDIRRAEKMTKKAVPEKSLPYFPLYKSGKTDTISSVSKNIRITTDDQGTIIDLNYGKSEVQAKPVVGYIIDASSLKDSPIYLTLDWKSENANFIMKVYLEGSDDLNSWRRLSSSTTLSKMQWDTHTLVQREIELPASSPKYLRISWTGNEELKLTTLTAHFSDTYQAQSRQWSTFSASKVDKEKSIYYFDTQSVIPIDRLNVRLPTKNTLLNVMIESAPTSQGPWYNRYRGLLYDLQFDENRLVTADIHQRINSHRHWRMRVINGGYFVAQPKLRLGWIPEQLLFVATGESPFTLVYGSAQVGASTAPLGMLLNESVIKQQGSMIKSAKLGATIDFGDHSRLEPVRPDLDWKKYILWFVLILGVLMLAFMALRLFKQMDQADRDE